MTVTSQNCKCTQEQCPPVIGIHQVKVGKLHSWVIRHEMEKWKY